MGFLDKAITASLPLIPKSLVRIFARPYIAGETLDELVRAARELNSEGYRIAAGILGELVSERAESERAVRDYEMVLSKIAELGIDGNIHVKLTHLGLKLDKTFCLENVRRLARIARERENFVRIDMEDSSCTDDTLDIYFQLREELNNVGAVIQACLRRSLDDVRELVKVKANVRLCKGIYIESRSIAYHDREIIRRNYALLLEELLSHGCYVGIATHDEMLVWEAYRTIDRLGLERDRYEFQMLYGVEAPLRRTIRDGGHRLRVAVPFGPNWYPYSLRRLRKNPAIAGYVLKALMKDWQANEKRVSLRDRPPSLEASAARRSLGGGGREPGPAAVRSEPASGGQGANEE